MYFTLHFINIYIYIYIPLPVPLSLSQKKSEKEEKRVMLGPIILLIANSNYTQKYKYLCGKHFLFKGKKKKKKL